MGESAKTSTDGGFGVDPAKLGGVAGQLGQALDGVEQAIAQCRSVQCTAADIGNPGLASVFESFDSGWVSALNVSSQAIKQLIAVTLGTGQSYAEAENVNVTAAGQAGSEA